MTRTARGWLLALCLLGLGASLASAYVHYRMLRDPSYTSFCDISATVNCGAVYESRFGTVQGVPVALGGVIWFALALLLTLGARREAATSRRRAEAERAGSNVPGYLFVLSTAALAFVLYLGYASFFILKAVCVLCVLTYVAVIGVFTVSGMSSEVEVRSVPRRALRDLRALARRPAALVAGLLFVAGAATAVAFFPREGERPSAAVAAAPVPISGQQQSEFARWFSSQPRVPIAVPNDGAAVVIVKFNDYQCPACGQTYMNYRSVLAKYRAERPGAVKLVTKDYPLEPECNPLVPQVVHQAACEGAVAVRLARTHQRDVAMEEWLYTNQSTLTPASVRQAAHDIGQVTDFDAQYPRILGQLKFDIDLARQLGVKVTPTFFINGVKVEGGLRPEYFDAAIAFELQQAGSAKPAKP